MKVVPATGPGPAVPDPVIDDMAVTPVAHRALISRFFSMQVQQRKVHGFTVWTTAGNPTGIWSRHVAQRDEYFICLIRKGGRGPDLSWVVDGFSAGRGLFIEVAGGRRGGLGMSFSWIGTPGK